MQNQAIAAKKPVNASESGAVKKNFRRDPKIRIERGAPQIKLTPPASPAETKTEARPDTSGWLTRNQSADLLRMSVTTIANYERRGKLHPQRAYRADSRGIEHSVAVYDPEELLKLPHPIQSAPAVREPGETAARCFELFNQGMTVRETVIELRETPERVRALHETWLDTGGADLTITEGAKGILEQLIGPFSGVAELLSLIEAIVKR